MHHPSTRPVYPASANDGTELYTGKVRIRCHSKYSSYTPSSSKPSAAVIQDTNGRLSASRTHIMYVSRFTHTRIYPTYKYVVKHIHIYTYTYTKTHAYIHYARTDAYVYLNVSLYTYIYIYIYVHVYMRSSIYIHVYRKGYIYMHANSHLYIHIHACVYTCTYTCASALLAREFSNIRVPNMDPKYWGSHDKDHLQFIETGKHSSHEEARREPQFTENAV